MTMENGLRHPSLPRKPMSVHPLPARPEHVTPPVDHSLLSPSSHLTPIDSGLPSRKMSTDSAAVTHAEREDDNAARKRKIEQVETSSGGGGSIIESFGNVSQSLEDAGENSKPKLIPILPTPLPSKRFKKGAQVRSLLIPVEQLPVYALPKLPVITDPILEKQVFQHQSMFEKVRGRFEDPEDQPAMHYEKLEHVGDSILGMIVTTWLQETKPLLTCGTASVS